MMEELKLIGVTLDGEVVEFYISEITGSVSDDGVTYIAGDLADVPVLTESIQPMQEAGQC